MIHTEDKKNMTQGPCHYILHNLEYKCRKGQVDVYVLHITMEIAPQI